MKQTAVEWLRDKLLNPDVRLEIDMYDFIYKLIDQAKEMEKQQMLEISDEEITKIAAEYILYNDSKRQWVIEGMKLYREQLINKL
jgi:translation initiation factor IF-2